MEVSSGFKAKAEARIDAWNETNLPWIDFRAACHAAVTQWQGTPDFTEYPDAIRREYEGVFVVTQSDDGKEHRIIQAKGGKLLREYRGRITIGVLKGEVIGA